MSKLAEYKKLIAAAVGIGVILLRQYTGIDLAGISPVLVDGMLSLITLVFVERVANKPQAA